MVHTINQDGAMKVFQQTADARSCRYSTDRLPFAWAVSVCQRRWCRLAAKAGSFNGEGLVQQYEVGLYGSMPRRTPEYIHSRIFRVLNTIGGARIVFPCGFGHCSWGRERFGTVSLRDPSAHLII